ncbi:hypothetical protein G7Y89_g9727 [Cudoniella acicularis]|uniref:Uncharacterized protein n=1 Tax=Cudoniella acicularis TaxID=354080 RepID=A0A8H4RE41_9HELO|nr:hypothetical protein G7Y89_g9727 [Cudoniella acicularis]
MWPSRSELKELMGMDDAQWASASYLEDLLHTLHQQREANRPAPVAYAIASRSMFLWAFRVPEGPKYDEKRKCLWYLGCKGPDEPEGRTLEIRHTFHVIQKGQYLRVYHDKKGQRSQGFLKFDMLKPHHRQRFLEVRHITEKYFPPEPPKHKDLLRVMHSPRGKKREALKNTLEKRGQKPSSQLRGESG